MATAAETSSPHETFDPEGVAVGAQVSRVNEAAPDDDEDEDPPSFRLGAEGGSQEILNSLQFSLAHAAAQQKDVGDPDHDLGFVDREEIGDHDDFVANKGVHFCDPDQDAVSGISLAIHRVDSRDVVFDNRAKKAKILGGNYVMGDVLGEGSYAKAGFYFAAFAT